MIAIGIAIDPSHLDADAIAAAVLTLALAAALWLIYFSHDDEHAEDVLSGASVQRRIRAALLGYFYSFIPMLLGVVAMAAGIKETLGHFSEELDVATSVAVAGGIALYLLGEASFRLVVGLGRVRNRIAAVVLVLATIALGTYVSAAVQLVAALAVLCAVIAADYVREPAPAVG